MIYTDAKLTEYEVEALSGKFNLADGHARFTLSKDYAQILRKIPQLLFSKPSQSEAEAKFSNAFFGAISQTEVLNLQRILYCPSASISIEIVANYLRMHKLSVALIEPTFDNLADILKRHGISMYPLREDHLRNFGIQDQLEGLKANAIFVVMPNNPTGYCFSESDFHYLVDFCIQNQKLLILDFSFRFFSPEMSLWKQYVLLEKAGVHYIAIEDTGKTWPTLDLKVSPLLSDKLTYSYICSIYRDFFMCHSPLVLILLSNIIEKSKEQGFEKSIWLVPRTNREALRQTIAETSLRPVSDSSMSVEWIYIEIALNDLDIVTRLKNHGIYILPGRNFFWNNPNLGSRFVRIALMRDISLFSEGMKLLQAILPETLNCN